LSVGQHEEPAKNPYLSFHENLMRAVRWHVFVRELPPRRKVLSPGAREQWPLRIRLATENPSRRIIELPLAMSPIRGVRRQDTKEGGNILESDGFDMTLGSRRGGGLGFNDSLIVLVVHGHGLAFQVTISTVSSQS